MVDFDLFCAVKPIEWLKYTEPFSSPDKKFPHLYAFQRQHSLVCFVVYYKFIFMLICDLVGVLDSNWDSSWAPCRSSCITCCSFHQSSYGMLIYICKLNVILWQISCRFAVKWTIIVLPWLLLLVCCILALDVWIARGRYSFIFIMIFSCTRSYSLFRSWLRICVISLKT